MRLIDMEERAKPLQAAAPLQHEDLFQLLTGDIDHHRKVLDQAIKGKGEQYTQAAESMRNLHACYQQFGQLNIEALVQDNLIKVRKNSAGEELVPIVTRKPCEKQPEDRILQFGQHDKYDQLYGVGKKIRISQLPDEHQYNYARIYIWEGQFKNDELNGFGRWIIISRHGYFACYTGHWKNGLRHGYGKIIFSNGNVKEGLFQNDEYCPEEDKIVAYDPKSNKVAKQLDFAKYVIKKEDTEEEGAKEKVESANESDDQ